jgi:polar amino acid transport system substrate-binding protein
MVLAVSAGLLIALVRLYLPTPLQMLSVVYVELIRGTPLLIQLFFIFYALPNIGIKLSPMVAAVLGLGLNYAAYEAENYRAGILSVPKGQMEAARALGLTQWQALRYVVLPQAVRIALPPITNDFISLLKDSSLVSVITMVELTKVYTQVSATTFDYFGTGLIVAALYLLLGLPFVRLARWVEGKLDVEQVQPTAMRGRVAALPDQWSGVNRVPGLRKSTLSLRKTGP